MEKWLEKFNALKLGEKIIIVAAVVLFIVGFLPWYSVDVGPFGDYTRNGWQSPGAIWSILAILIGLAMAGVIVLKNFATVEIPDNVGGFTWPRIYLGAGVVAFLFVVIKLANEASHMGFAFYVGIIATAALAGAGFLMYREEREAP